MTLQLSPQCCERICPRDCNFCKRHKNCNSQKTFFLLSHSYYLTYPRIKSIIWNTSDHIFQPMMQTVIHFRKKVHPFLMRSYRSQSFNSIWISTFPGFKSFTTFLSFLLRIQCPSYIYLFGITAIWKVRHVQQKPKIIQTLEMFFSGVINLQKLDRSPQFTAQKITKCFSNLIGKGVRAP